MVHSNVSEIGADPGELKWLLETLNDTAIAFPREAFVHDLIAAQVARTPDATAVVCDNVSLTYRGLDCRANRIARRLRELTPGVGRNIAIALDRSTDMLAVMLAVMKAGHTYVPLDTTHPIARLRETVAASNLALVITDRGSLEFVPADVSVMSLAAEARNIDGCDDSPLTPAPTTSEQAAYVIFTSGSTGTPKGVAVPHQSVVNFLLSMAREPGLSADDVVVAVTTISFDIAVLELFLPLCVGAKVVIAPRDAVRSGFSLLTLIEECGATVLQGTPSLWRLLLEIGFKPGKRLKMLCGGEGLPQDLAEALVADGGELWNMYGPTETTVWSSCVRVVAGAPISIGAPIANTQLFVLDADDRPTPIGEAGQLYIGGHGLALGYYNRPDLTDAAFRMVTLPGLEPQRLYNTGDLARRLPTGELILLGRSDQQIKLRGFRIEIEEIETVLRRAPGVAAAAVALRGASAPRLVGYIVPSEDALLDEARIVEYAAAHLPEYMVPTAWVSLVSLPLTANQKLDRKALPEPGAFGGLSVRMASPHDPGDSTGFAEANNRSETEARLARIWADILNVPDVAPDAHFFDLGGHSLLAVRMIAKVREDFGVRIDPVALFKSPTLRAFAASIVHDPAPDDDWRVVRLQAHGTGAPIIALNNPLIYYGLSKRFGDAHQFTILQNYNQQAPQVLQPRSMDEIAADYVELVRGIQPKGPYILVGLCIAGIVALEVAQQLKKAGETVSLLVMADTFEPSVERGHSWLDWIQIRTIDRVHDFQLRFSRWRAGKLSFLEFLRSWRAIRRSGIFEAMKSAGLITRMPESEFDNDAHGNWFLQHLLDANDQYIAKPYDGDVLLLRSEEVPRGHRRYPEDFGWPGLLTGDVQILDVPGLHVTMFGEPGASTIANAMARHFKSASAR